MSRKDSFRTALTREQIHDKARHLKENFNLHQLVVFFLKPDETCYNPVNATQCNVVELGQGRSVLQKYKQERLLL